MTRSEGPGRPERGGVVGLPDAWHALCLQYPIPVPEEKRAWLDGLTNVAMGSDAFIPFRDNIDRAAMSGVKYVVQPGGSVRDEDVVAACDQYGMVMAISGVRLFHH